MAISTEDLLRSWFRRMLQSQVSHYETARALESYNYWLGLPAILFATFVGTSVFAALGRLVDRPLADLCGVGERGRGHALRRSDIPAFLGAGREHRSVGARTGR